MLLGRASSLWFLAGVSCASPPHGARRTAADIERSEVVPAGYVALGTAHARCGAAPSWGHLDTEPLTRFECRSVVLERALAQQAVARGGSLLAGLRCRGSSGALACTATVAAPAEGTTVLVDAQHVTASVPGDELPFEKARAIDVDLEPFAERFSRRARESSEVGVQQTLPVSHRALGSMTARCDKNECSSDDLRVALRVAAGALGASDVAGVACGFRRDDAFCVATLAAAELDPETDPGGR